LLVVDNAARIGHFQTCDDPQQSCLARTGRAKQSDTSPVRHFETDIVERDEATECLRNILDQYAHGRASSFAGSGRSAAEGSFLSSLIFAIKVAIASKVSKDATANDPGRLYSWNSFSIRNGIVSVWPAMWPETT